jgi:hypothetical protein
MADIRDYITLSKTASSIVDTYSIPDGFKEFYKKVSSNEKKSLLRHFIVNNVPFAFKTKPILYEQLTQYIADKLQIAPSEVKLIGSAKTGFSISPPPYYGNNFGSHSDLDFSIVNEEIFNDMEGEFQNWANLFREKQITAYNETEERYWFQNLDSGAGQIRNGFIDTHLIPNRDLFVTTKKINNSMWLIKKYLEERHKLIVKKASASIYKSWGSFAGRLNRNTENVMKRV